MHITKKDRNKDKNLKKESDVGILLTGKQAQKQAACRDGLQNTNKLHVGCHHENQCDETIQQFLALHQ